MVLTVRDVLSPGPDQWVNAVVEVHTIGQIDEIVSGDLCDASAPGTVMSQRESRLRFTWPVDDPTAVDGLLERLVERVRGWLEAVDVDAVLLSACLELSDEGRSDVDRA
jgi:hypothetical protein